MPGTTPTTLKVSVWRGADEGEFQRFDVPRMESQTVLDVVIYIQRHLDATLSYRFACRVGICGALVMTVNGRAHSTCRHQLTKVLRHPDDVHESATLKQLPVVKDLATNMTGFFDKWRHAKGYFAGQRTRAEPAARVDPASPARK